MRVSILFGACALFLCARGVSACTPPAAMHLESGPAGASIPYFNEYAYAYVGKVVGYSENEWKDPALAVEVLDAWTPMQKKGDVLKVSVQPWSGCGLPHARGNFDPSKYPIGTRLRVITFAKVIDIEDAKLALVVIGVAP
jgi:hypothetical protein